MSEKETIVVNSALRQLERYSPSLAKRYYNALQELNKPKRDYTTLERQIKEFVDDISAEDLAKKMMEYGMKFKNPPV